MLWTVDVNSDMILKMEYATFKFCGKKGWRADIITGYFPLNPFLIMVDPEIPTISRFEHLIDPDVPQALLSGNCVETKKPACIQHQKIMESSRIKFKPLLGWKT